MSHAHSPGRRRPRAQALVEFALVVPVFMFIFAGMVQLGVILWASNTLNQVVRDTGRYAATICASPHGAADVGLATARFASLYAASAGPWRVAPGSPVVTYASDAGSPPCADDNTEGVWVTVTASSDAFVLFPFVPANGRVSSSATLRVEPRP